MSDIYNNQEDKVREVVGAVRYEKESDGSENWYDQNDRMIHRRSTMGEGYQFWYYYDDNGNMTRAESNKGDYELYEYENGKLKRIRYSDGTEDLYN